MVFAKTAEQAERVTSARRLMHTLNQPTDSHRGRPASLTVMGKIVFKSIFKIENKIVC